MTDMVDAPPHYTRLHPQPIEVIEAWDLDFPLGSALKYIARAGFKDGADAVTDLRKAVSFINRKIVTLSKCPPRAKPGELPKDSDA